MKQHEVGNEGLFFCEINFTKFCADKELHLHGKGCILIVVFRPTGRSDGDEGIKIRLRKERIGSGVETEIF